MAKLKILHINTFKGGGSGIAALRLHRALRQHGYDSRYMFFDKGAVTDSEFQYARRRYWWIFILRVLKKLGLPFTIEQRNDYSIRKYKYNFEMFSFATTAYTHLHEHPLVQDSDIIHLHWVSNFVDFPSFFEHIKKPIVWTLHDMNAFLGGFHYQGDEAGYAQQLHDLDEQQKVIKRRALNQLPSDQLSIVTPSSWLYHLSEESETLKRFPHYHIPNGVDIRTFRIREATREIRKNEKINVLFAAESLHNRRKGFALALDVISDADLINRCHFMAIGYVKKAARLPYITYYGIINGEDRMSELYNEADIFLLPSCEDNLPNCMVESLCCGTPVVGFAIGGVKESVTNGRNGYLSEDVSVAGLKIALLQCIENIESLNREAIAEDAHRKYGSDVSVKAITKLYYHSLHLQKESTNVIL